MKKIKKNKELIIVHNQSYKDKRGYFKEILLEKNIKKKFPFLVMSYSKKNVLRGLHLQMKKSQGKYISVIKGKIFDVIVDLRKHSKTFGKWKSVILDSKMMNMVFVPSGFAHGFQTLAPDCEILYLHTDYHNQELECGYNYNSQNLKINWPLEVTQISERDRNLKFFQDKRKSSNHEV